MKKILTLCMALLCQVLLSQPIWVGQVLQFNQGLNNDGGPVSPFRSLLQNCIGVAQASDTPTPEQSVNFVSLGFKGQMVVMMESPIKNIEGFDLKVHETTFNTPSCRRYPEKIMLFASQDACNWYFCGYTCQDGEFDLGELNWAQYFKLVDVSPYGSFEPFGVCDGFDVDGIEGYQVETEMTSSTLVTKSAQHVVDFRQGLRKNGTPVSISRSNPENALGLPQGTETINFVSLGFGGQLILKFDYTVFNREGFDFQITETSFGNPLCQNYPEKALIEVSMDMNEWSVLDIVCLDGMVEMGSVNCFQYIKISDRSAASSFSSTADGYDVDGVFSLSDCGVQRRVDFDDVVTMDEEPELILTPNPFNESIIFNTNESKHITIYNYVGSKVKEFVNITTELDTKDLPSGVYYFKVTTKDYNTSHKLFKK